jgi:4-alpha-glucanotransferase
VFGRARPANHGSVSDPELVQRARNAGIITDYDDWRGERVEVPAETLAAILDVLDQPPAVDEQWAARDVTGPGGIGPDEAITGAFAAGGRDGLRPRLTLPAERQWGFTIQLYSVRSSRSWGHGDLRDLAELARWSASELGAGFVLVNPLHAAEPLPPISPSPYLPMTRMFTSPLYLRVEDILEYAALPTPEKDLIAGLAAPLRAANCTPDLIDRDAVWTAKRRALEMISKVPLTEPRQAAYDRFCAEGGRRLQEWSAWCALAEWYGPDWRDWPEELADPRRAIEIVSGDAELAAAAEFHGWLQWHADQQLAAAQDAAKTAGMAYGIIDDLAVGVHPGGADAWAMQGLLVPGFSVGAPPDGFNQVGQDWSQPPWHPRRLAAEHYRPMAELFGAALRRGGGIRVDHVLGLMRLWWIPAGQLPDRGAYVRYDHDAAVGALAGTAARMHAVAIGEDLGTVDPWVHDYLADHGILGTMMLWFARADDGTPLPPAHWRRACMATVGTHDVPPVSGFLTGEQVTIRSRLGLLRTSEDQERAESEELLASWQAALVAEGLLEPGQQPDAGQFTVALYGFLRKTPALLLGVSLADAVGERRTQNIPGTSDEYPNWQLPLCDDGGCPVLIEQLAGIGLLREVCQAVRGNAAVLS